jgi:hypothetical protein
VSFFLLLILMIINFFIFCFCLSQSWKCCLIFLWIFILLERLEHQRSAIANEILTTETTYVKNLEILIQVLKTHFMTCRYHYFTILQLFSGIHGRFKRTFETRTNSGNIFKCFWY